MMKKLMAAALLALAAPQTAIAQDAPAPPLNVAMFNETWAVIDFAGKTTSTYPPMITFTEGLTVAGKTPCATGWSGRLRLNLPQLRIANVTANGDNCSADAKADSARFLAVLEQVHSARSGQDGLELLDAAGERVMLLVMGG